MENVDVISTTIVRPDNINNRLHGMKIHLTPWDFSFLRSSYAQRGLVFPKPDPGTDIISRLEASLSIALENFYPLAGRLVKVENNDETASFYIDCDGSRGVKFVHARAETLTVSDVLGQADGHVHDLIKCFFPANGMKSFHGVSEPLFAAQVTELKDGVFFSFCYNHLVADGFSAWDFFHTWSELCSTGAPSGHREKIPPLRLKGWFLDEIDYPLRIPLAHVPLPTTKTSTGVNISDSPILREKIFHFSKENISKLKAKANEEVGSRDRKISSFQAILGHMWSSITRHSDMNREQEIRCKLAVNIRQRLNPRLEKESFGCMVAFGTVTTTAGEMLEQEPSGAALQINKMVGSHTNEYLRKYAENWVKNIEIPDLGVGSGKICTSLLVAGSPWFNVYDNDFGWGKPTVIRVGPGNMSNGEIMLFPGTEEGSIIAQTCLSSDLFVKLSADVGFLENVTIL